MFTAWFESRPFARRMPRPAALASLSLAMLAAFSLAASASAGPSGPASRAGLPNPFDATATLTTAVSEHSVVLHWLLDGDEGFNDHVTSWLVTVRPGTHRPGSGDRPTAVLSSKTMSYTVSGLLPGKPYTATIRTRDSHGDLSRPITVTFSTRDATTHSLVRSDGEWHASTLPLTDGTTTQAATVVASNGGRDVLYTARGRVYFTASQGVAGWSTPLLLAAGQFLKPGTVYLSESGGEALAGWQNFGHPEYRLRPAGSTTWGPTHSLGLSGHLRGLVLDPAGKVHALIDNYYVTNVSGPFTNQRLPQSGSSYSNEDRSALTIDPVTGQIVVADTVAPFSVPNELILRVASGASTATTLGPWHLAHDLPGVVVGSRVDDFDPSVVSDDGQITFGLSGAVRLSYPKPGVRKSYDGVYVMSGPDVAHLSGFTRVPGSDISASDLVLGADSAGKTVLAWSEHDALWRTTREGVFTETESFSDQHPVFSAPRQRSTSAYDSVSGFTPGPAGELVLTYVTSQDGDNLIELP